MKNILFINSYKEQCGVYQYGERTYNILRKSSKFNFVSIKIDFEDSFGLSNVSQVLLDYNPIAIIYNYHPLTMGWLGNEFLKFFSCPQFGIHHEGGKPNIAFTDFIDIDSLKENGAPRPLFDRVVYKEVKSKNLPTCPIINSFGFGFANKGFGRVCKIVNEQFDNAIIRLHIPFAYYGDRDQQSIKNIHPGCRNEITKSGIELQITTDFKTDEELLHFLSEGDLNIFLYDDMPERGLSSVIDYVLSVNTPLAINRTGMFRHIYDAMPNICVESDDLRQIMHRGIEPLMEFRRKWSNLKLVEFYENLIIKHLSK